MPEIDSGDAPIRATAEQVYQWAVEHGTAPRPHQEAVRTGLGLSAEQVRGAVGFLLGLRLLQPVDAAGVLAPVSPDAAAEALIGARSARLFAQEADLHSQQSELLALQAEIAGFDTAYRRGQAGRERSGPVKIVRGGEAVRGYLDMTVRESRTEVLVCQPGSGSQEALDEALPRDLALLARGIRLRSLYQHPARFNASTRAYAARAIAAGSQIRTTAELPPRMILVDRTIALLSETHEAAGAVVVREPTTVGVLCAVFELAWSSATPFKTAVVDAREALSETETRIINLLAAGVTDKAAGTRLGMSERTVRAHIRKLYDKLGATSRFQAGFMAATQQVHDPE